MQIVPNFRVRTIPVLGTAPAIFGMAAASFVLCHLAGTPFQGEPIFTIQQEKLDVQYDRLLMREELRVGDDSEMFVDIYEVQVQLLQTTALLASSHLTFRDDIWHMYLHPLTIAGFLSYP